MKEKSKLKAKKSERKKMSETDKNYLNRFSDKVYKLIEKNSDEAVFFADEKGIILECNKNMARIFESSSDKIIGKTIGELINSPGPAIEKKTGIIDEQDIEASRIRCSKDKEKTIEVRIFKFDDNERNLLGGIVRDISKRQKAIDDLANSEARFRSMAENMNDGLSIIENQKVVYSNSRLSEITGYSASELRELSSFDICAPEEKSRIQRIRDKHYKKGTFPESLEYWIITKDSKRKFIRNRYSFVEEEKRNYLFLITSDITNDKIQTDTLKDAERRYRSIFENATVGIYQSTPDGRLLDANFRLAKMFGFDEPEEMLKSIKNVKEQLYAEPTERDEIIHEVFSKGDAGYSEIKLKRKDGNYFWMSDHVRAVRDEDGKILYFEGWVSDITRRKNFEAALRESEMLSRAMLNATFDAAVLIDKEFHILAVNHAMADILGDSIEDIIGKNILLLTPDDLKANRKDAILKVIESKKPLRYEDSQNGNIFDTTIYPIHNDEGKVDKLTIFAHDITEQKKIEEKIRDMNKELEMRVNERTALLHDAMEDLRISNYSKDKFFGIIAHALKNPIQALLLTSNMLIDYHDDFDEVQLKRNHQQIFDSTRYLNDLLENLLEWAKSRSGKLTFKPSKFMIGNAVDEVLQIYSTLAKGKNIDIAVDIDKNSEIFADRNMIISVISNLISNAIKFTSENGKILVSSEKIHNSVYVSVKDTGIGITEEDIKKLFQIDVKHSTKGTSQEQGKGIGLLLCKEFVEKHGGRIWVDSKPGEGTVLKFSIPIKLSKM